MMRGLPIMMIGSDYSEAAHSEAAERFVHYAHSERARPVLQRWAPWMMTPAGLRIMAQLSALADDLLCGEITDVECAETLLALAPSTPMSRGDLEVLARVAVEFCRCAFFGAGYVPIVDTLPDELGGAA